MEAALQQVGPESDNGRKIRTALILLAAHMNDHGRLVAEIAPQQQPGRPVAENQLRAQAAGAAAAGETEAEAAGQPQNGDTAQTPDGIAVQ
jgi:hypothetical protein